MFSRKQGCHVTYLGNKTYKIKYQATEVGVKSKVVSFATSMFYTKFKNQHKTLAQ